LASRFKQFAQTLFLESETKTSDEKVGGDVDKLSDAHIGTATSTSVSSPSLNDENSDSVSEKDANNSVTEILSLLSSSDQVRVDAPESKQSTKSEVVDYKFFDRSSALKAPTATAIPLM